MNKENMLKLADFIEKLPSKRFDMGDWIRVGNDAVHSVPEEIVMDPFSCDTKACVAGWAVLALGNDEQKRAVAERVGRAENIGQEILGLSEWEAERLFYGRWGVDGYGPGLARATTKGAAAELRRLAGAA